MLRYFTPEEIALFWSCVVVAGPDECWPYVGLHNQKRYGIFAGTTAHRVAFYITHEQQELPLFSIVCHTCDNPPCCNPAHLWLGTQRDNMHDMIRKGRDAPSKRRRAKGDDR